MATYRQRLHRKNASGGYDTIHLETSAAAITGTLGVSHGGTGITSNPNLLTNLASTSSDTIFESSPRPGVTGILPVAHGGTGESTLEDFSKALAEAGGSGGIMAILGSSRGWTADLGNKHTTVSCDASAVPDTWKGYIVLVNGYTTSNDLSGGTNYYNGILLWHVNTGNNYGASTNAGWSEMSKSGGTAYNGGSISGTALFIYFL